MNFLLNLSLILLGSIAGNLLIAGYFIYGIPLTLVGLALVFLVIKADRKEREFTQKLVDKPIY
ncbi:MAG TPA: hypothetical protein VFF30_09335 [Nitrososphaerales archaeon]|nr:hypothetical protein [Nitrososphaerales archaeon]